MTKRKAISKKLRFEVFKRDKFQCQYCGKSAPDVILNIDHINPVAKGGNNEILNLITSCFDCNQGKKARLLSDDTVVKKQKKQLELIQERREQLELMLEWKNSLKEFESEKIKMVSDYWASMMQPYSLNENGLKSLEKLMKKFSVEEVLEGIEIATEKYIKFDEEGNITKESVEDAFNKVGGICTLKNMPETNQKMAYVKGIGRNRFSYWDNKKGSIILQNYVQALRDYGWTEQQIIDDIENEVTPKTKEAKNWSEWRNILEQWTDDVNNWKIEVQDNPSKELSNETLETHVNMMFGEINDRLEALHHIGKIFPEFDSEKTNEILVNDLKQIASIGNKDTSEYELFISNCSSQNLFEIPEDPIPENLGVLIVFEGIATELIENILNEFNLERTSYSENNKEYIRTLINKRLNK